MKVRLIAPRNVIEYAEKHSGSMPLFEKFLEDIEESEWDTPNQIKTTFSSADLIGDSRVIFDIGGNHYRVICKYVVKSTEFVLYLKWVGNHNEYTKLCKKGLQYTIDNY